jgi:hypothetical protein
VPNNRYGLPSPGGEIFTLTTQYTYPTLERHDPIQSMVANANPPIASTSAQQCNSFNPSIADTHPYAWLAYHVDSLFFEQDGFYNYYFSRSNSLLFPEMNFSILKTPNQANRAVDSPMVQSHQQLNLVSEQHTIVEPSIVHTTNTSPQLRSTSGATARRSRDNNLTVTQVHSTTNAITTLNGHFDIKEEAELQQPPSFAMKAPELSRSQSLGMDDLSPHHDQEMSGEDDSYDYADPEDLLVPDASITELDVGLDTTAIEQGVRFPGDLYTPVWVRFQGKHRQGRCEQCVHLNRKIIWFKLRTSQYL